MYIQDFQGVSAAEMTDIASSLQCDNDTAQYAQYVWITTYQPDTKSNRSPNATTNCTQ